MNTWIFSKNGVVTEPLDLAKAKKYVVDNPDAYAWQSSFTQWLPVNSINEFASLLPKQKVAAQIPQKLVEEFRTKEQKLDSQFDKLQQDLAVGEINAQNFAQEIATYKELTVNLSDEVKNNISEIEQEYHVLVKQLKTVRLEIKSSHKVLDNVVKVFNEKIDSKAIIETAKSTDVGPVVEIKSQSKAALDTEKKTVASEDNTSPVEVDVARTITTESEVVDSEMAKSTIADQGKVKAISTRVPKPQGAKVISTRSKHPNSVRLSSTAQSDKKIEKLSPTASNTDSANKQQSAETVEPKLSNSAKVKQSEADKAEQESQANNLHAKLESGVKNIFKTVFNKEQPIEQKSKFAELVQQDKVNEEVKAVEKVQEIEEVVQMKIHDDETLTKPRKRRRR